MTKRTDPAPVEIKVSPEGVDPYLGFQQMSARIGENVEAAMRTLTSWSSLQLEGAEQRRAANLGRRPVSSGPALRRRSSKVAALKKSAELLNETFIPLAAEKYVSRAYELALPAAQAPTPAYAARNEISKAEEAGARLALLLARLSPLATEATQSALETSPPLNEVSLFPPLTAADPRLTSVQDFEKMLVQLVSALRRAEVSAESPKGEAPDLRELPTAKDAAEDYYRLTHKKPTSGAEFVEFLARILMAVDVKAAAEALEREAAGKSAPPPKVSKAERSHAEYLARAVVDWWENVRPAERALPLRTRSPG
jgi:hypothetical protein